MKPAILMQWATRGVLALAVVILAYGLISWVAQRRVFDFQRIVLLGSDPKPKGAVPDDHAQRLAPRHVNALSIRALLGASPGEHRGAAPSARVLAGNFFTMDLNEARRLIETLPWVARASVRRVWPNQLVVTVDEYQAVGLWSDGRVLSRRGELFVANPAEAELDGDLVDVDGPAAYATEVAQRLHAINARLAPLNLRVASLRVSERAAWSVATVGRSVDQTSKVLRKGPYLELGRDEPTGRLDDRLGILIQALPKVVAQLGRWPTRMDARYASGFAVAASE